MTIARRELRAHQPAEASPARALTDRHAHARIAPDDVVAHVRGGGRRTRARRCSSLEPLERVPRRARARRGDRRRRRRSARATRTSPTLIARGGWEAVLRRPPRPPLPPERPRRAARGAPPARARAAPRACPACSPSATTRAVIGAPFYVMERSTGTSSRRRSRPRSTRAEERRAHGRASSIDALVEIHAVDWRAAGLEGFGRPTGYLERQLRRFGGLWEHNKHARAPGVRRGRRLARRAPARVRRRRPSCTATTGSAT